jgi:hypothetical protein
VGFVLVVVAAFAVLSVRDLIKYLIKRKRRPRGEINLKEKSFKQIMLENVQHIIGTILVIVLFILTQLWNGQ